MRKTRPQAICSFSIGPCFQDWWIPCDNIEIQIQIGSAQSKLYSCHICFIPGAQSRFNHILIMITAFDLPN